MRHCHRRATAGALLAALALLTLAATARAQDAGNGFLFATPRASLTFRAGWAAANAGSDLFSFTTKQLTLNHRDFSSPALDLDVAVRLAPRVDVVLSSSYAGTTRKSEFRDFVDNANKPIEQTTTFQRVPVTASIRAYLTPRGRSIGRFAWIPAKVAPYVAAGGGLEWYRFHQDGDFVDFNSSDLAVHNWILETKGWGPTAHAAVGADYSLGPRFALTGETRYSWGRAPVRGDFKGFDQRADLSGLTTTAGLTVRF